MPDLGPLPRLTKPQMARLVEIGDDHMPFVTVKEKATGALLTAGAVERYVEQRMGGRYPKVRLTSLGIRILAGFPGDEFDRFREALAREKHHVE